MLPKSMTYPTCAHSFKAFYTLSRALINRFVSKIYRVRPFDVTLRDGLQGLNIDEQRLFTTERKKEIYNHIIHKYNPVNLEVTSCVNTKLLPVFNDYKEIFKYTEEERINLKYDRTLNNYILVPNQKYLFDALNLGATNFSFITSTSNSFQFKNTKMDLNENLINLKNMMIILKESNIPYKVKLYLSCINECPIEGKISVEKIVDRLIELQLLNFDNICLSDTCGTLTKTDFIDIIENSKKAGIDAKIFSLHLHIKPERENDAEEIVHTALSYGILEFDVSDLNTGGCSVTMDANKLVPNMSYKQYYRFLTNYLFK